MSHRQLRGPLTIDDVLYQTAAGNVTVVNESVVVLAKSTPAATTVTLPAGTRGRTVIIKDDNGDSSTYPITVSPASGNIDDATSYVIAENRATRTFFYNGTQWNVLGGGGDSGTGATASGLSVVESGDGAMHRTVFLFDGYSLTTTDNGTAGNGGGAKIYDFPQGYIGIYGVSQAWNTITVDGTGFPNDVAMEIGIGTTVATSSMGSLTGTAEDIATGDTFTLSSSLSAVNRFLGSVSAGHYVDGSVTAKDAYLNITGTAATADGDATIVLTGTVTVLWSSVGLKPS